MRGRDAAIKDNDIEGNDLMARWCGCGSGVVRHVFNLKSAVPRAWRSFDRARKNIGGRGATSSIARILYVLSSIMAPTPRRRRMPMPARFFLGAVALCGICMLVLACRSGRICSVGRCYEADENPVSYGLTFALNIFVVIFVRRKRPDIRLPKSSTSSVSAGSIPSAAPAAMRSAALPGPPPCSGASWTVGGYIPRTGAAFDPPTVSLDPPPPASPRSSMAFKAPPSK